jgi:hypothetical protein
MPYRTFRATRTVQIGAGPGAMSFTCGRLIQYDGHSVVVGDIAYPVVLRPAIQAGWFVEVPEAQALPQPGHLRHPAPAPAAPDKGAWSELPKPALDRLLGEDDF